jgi:hypothetical protein
MWRVRQTCAAVTFEAQQQLRQLGDIHRNPARLIFGETDKRSNKYYA